MRVMRTANVGQWRAFLVQFVPLFRFSPKGYELGNIFGRILAFFCRIIKSVEKEKTLQITEFVGFISFLSLTVVAIGRRERDSNPRYLAVRRFSRPLQSITLPSLQSVSFFLRRCKDTAFSGTTKRFFNSKFKIHNS